VSEGWNFTSEILSREELQILILGFNFEKSKEKFILFYALYLLFTNSIQFTYLLTTPWYRIFFEKLIVTQLSNNIPLSLWNPRFITVFTKYRHWTPS